MTTGAVVLDIEGVTSSLSSVQDQLFPYARRHVGEWVLRPEAASLVDEARAVAGRPDATPGEIAGLMRAWIDADAKVPVLKSLQGMMWEAGFAAGELAAHLYDDVPEAMGAWWDAGVRVYVYSSGSVLAQRLWFGHTAFGDLTPRLSGYFDTRNAGPKRDRSSYEAITAAIGIPAGRTLFASDTPEELDAAQQAGWRTVQVVRPGENVRPATGHRQASDLRQVGLDPAFFAGTADRQHA